MKRTVFRVSVPCRAVALWVGASLALLPAGLAQTAAAPATADGWSQFRGPDRAGVSAEVALLRSWPEAGPKQLWRQTVGEGLGGVAIAGERFFIAFAVGEEEFLGAFRTADGGELWRVKIGATFHDQFGNGPRSTPSVDGDLVYVLSGLGNLVAAQAATGELAWQVDLKAEHGFYGPQMTPTGVAVGVLQQPGFGYVTSPLVEGDVVVVETGTGKGHPDAQKAAHGQSWVAFDKKTGETRWTAVDEPGITYSSPTAVTLAGRRQILILTPSEVVSLAPATGEVYWRQPWGLTCSVPVLIPPDRVFVSTTEVAPGNGINGSLMLRIQDDGGQAVVERVWESQVMKNFWSASVPWDGYLYGYDNATFRCISIEDGEQQWAKRGLGKGSLVAADGLLLLWSDQGKLTLIEASPEEYRQHGQVQVFEEGRTWTPPALADGKVYLRGQTDVACYDLKNP